MYIETFFFFQESFLTILVTHGDTPYICGLQTWCHGLHTSAIAYHSLVPLSISFFCTPSFIYLPIAFLFHCKCHLNQDTTSVLYTAPFPRLQRRRPKCAASKPDVVRFSTSDEGIRVLEDILQYSSAKVGMFHPGYKPVALTLLWAFERLFFILLQLLVTAHLDVQRFQFQVCMTPIIYTLHRDPSGYH